MGNPLLLLPYCFELFKEAEHILTGVLLARLLGVL